MDLYFPTQMSVQVFISVSTGKRLRFRVSLGCILTSKLVTVTGLVTLTAL